MPLYRVDFSIFFAWKHFRHLSSFTLFKNKSKVIVILLEFFEKLRMFFLKNILSSAHSVNKMNVLNSLNKINILK